MRKPTIGFFRENAFLNNTPNHIYLLKLKLCYANGLDAVCFSVNELDTLNDTVNTFVWTKDGLKREITKLPALVEYGGGTKMRDYFRSKCTVIDDFNLSKKDVNDLLIKTEFAGSVIPSLYTTIPPIILTYLNIWNEIIVKPIAGARGEGIISIKQNREGNYTLTDAEGEIGVKDYNESIDFLSKYYNNSPVMVQPRLSFVNKNGDTMDFRINITKNGKGMWETIFIIPRTSREKIISNFSQGAYASLLESTLKIDFGENSETVLNELKRIAEKLPPIIEEASACNMLSLGIDVGFEYNTLNPYIIEVNYVPKLTFPDKLKYHYTQSEYFTYLAQKLNDNSL